MLDIIHLKISSFTTLKINYVTLILYEYYTYHRKNFYLCVHFLKKIL